MNTKFSELSLGAAVYIIVAMVALAIGFYGIFKVVANYMIFEKYPVSSGGMSMMFGGGYYQTEADCMYVRTYYDDKGIGMRSPSNYESSIEQQEKDRCLSQVVESRKMAQINDIIGSLITLSIGAGLFYAREYIFKD